MQAPVLTIDGPSGAGKGTVSRAVAKKLDWNYLDSGSIYRSLAIAVLDANIALDDTVAIVNLAETMNLRFECADELTVFLDGQDITRRLSSETTGNCASKIAVIKEVRAALLQKQRDFQKTPGLVADGRDMGTVVFPQAQKKVFLTASAEERAKRRYKQLIEKGIDANLEKIANEIIERDKRDSERENAPLAQAENALFLDSTGLPATAVIDEVLQYLSAS